MNKEQVGLDLIDETPDYTKTLEENKKIMELRIKKAEEKNKNN